MKDNMTVMDILNEYYSDDILQDILIINDQEYHVDTEHSSYSKEITETITGNNSTYQRAGFKEISYERWVDTHWYDWEEV